MDVLRSVRSAAACLLAFLLLCPAASAAYSSSADVISAALGEVGTIEGPNEYSKYGEWYGLPNAYWCDMFVSWCAMAGGVPASQFPRHASCTDHVKRFVKLGWYQESSGNSYIPRQGDVIFFYHPAQYPSGSVKNHTGLVLYVEDGYVYTIEGNALANRLDIDYETVAELRDDDLDPPDYVTVNCYPLDAPWIHGYGIPAYDDRTPLQLSGFVDLGRHRQSAEMFQALCEAGVMRPTSTHTFSPNHGMTRADFTEMTVNFFGLVGYDPETAAFADVPPESDSYDAIMCARSGGIICGGEGNQFLPDRYITPSDAQTILNRALAYVGLEERTFSFSAGDYSYVVSPYVIRADIAAAFDALCRDLPLSEAFEGDILLDNAVQNWPARCLDGVCYVLEESLAFLTPEEPGDETSLDEESADEEALPPYEAVEADREDESVPEEDRSPVSLWNTDRVLPTAVTLQNGEESVDAAGLIYRGERYVSLPEAAELFSLDMEQREPLSIVLTSRGDSEHSAE